MNLIKMALKNTGFKQIRIQYNFTNIKKKIVPVLCHICLYYYFSILERQFKTSKWSTKIHYLCMYF